MYVTVLDKCYLSPFLSFIPKALHSIPSCEDSGNKQTKKDWQFIKYSKGANLATRTYQASPVFLWAS